MARVVWCALALGGVRTLGAQRGGTSTLVIGAADAETGAALEGAEVILVDQHRLGRANRLGEATLTGEPRGKQHVVRTWDLAAVEFYNGSQVPVRYRTKSYGCGVLLLWSKWY